MHTFSGQFVFACYATAFVYWIVAAFWTKRTAKAQPWGRWPTRAGAIALIVLLMFRRRASATLGDPHLWSYTPAIGIAASLVTMAGLIVLLWARASLAGNWSADVVLKEDHELIVRGPYRYVRHPIYSGFILMAIGGVLLWGTTLALAMLIALPVLLWFKLSQEERLLTAHFPDAYSRYQHRVKALVPFLV
jgi:protein-S-isoprenylcysteine O-methyltransferase Ste14